MAKNIFKKASKLVQGEGEGPGDEHGEVRPYRMMLADLDE